MSVRNFYGFYELPAGSFKPPARKLETSRVKPTSLVLSDKRFVQVKNNNVPGEKFVSDVSPRHKPFPWPMVRLG